ncbi:MAG: TPR end-of-group domain-containing protein [Planctomycetota bacterium]|jgi:tetratricopeptide (TPR) repeat protein
MAEGTKIISKWWRGKWDWQKPHFDCKIVPGGQRGFEVAFFETVARRQGDFWEVLAALGNHYTVEKRYREGLAVDRRLAQLRPDDPIVFYNLACSYSLVGWIPQALNALERSLALGYQDFRHISQDNDLDALRKDARFRNLLSKYARV